uniref:Uncharacterized protein n=1 Tax=Rhodnius prolixus TaxID=13249 RepID=T1HG64_RHOPR
MGYQGGNCAKKGEDRSFGRKDSGDCLLGFARNNPHRLSGKGILSKTQFDNAFIGLLFACGAYDAKNVRYCPFLWNKK